MKQVAFYWGCTEEDFWETLVSVKSVREMMPGVKCVVFSKYLSQKMQRVLAKNEVEYVRIDLAEAFSREWKNPLASYLIFAGPEYIGEQGYKYAVYVEDGAICKGGDINTTANIRKVTGAVYFNTQFAKKTKLLKTAKRIYAKRMKLHYPDTSCSSILGEIMKGLPAEEDEAAESFTLDETTRQEMYQRYFPGRRLISLPCKKKAEIKLHGEPIATHWYRSDLEEIRNFGDELSRDLIPRLFGRRVKLAELEECQLITVGSVLEAAAEADKQHTVKVWGSGFIAEGEGENLEGLKFLAVRGELTRERVGGGNLAMGDPGLLASRIYPKSRRKNQLVGVVAHYVDIDSPLVRRLREDDRFLVINTLDEPERVARQISACKLILSSSLHGLIFADSYGVPNIHIQFSNKVIGGDYKFEDYYTVVKRKHEKADKARIFDDDYLEELRRQYRPVKNLKKIQRDLIRAFPYK